MMVAAALANKSLRMNPPVVPACRRQPLRVLSRNSGDFGAASQRSGLRKRVGALGFEFACVADRETCCCRWLFPIPEAESANYLYGILELIS
jgi:hypothetical protein